MFFKISFVVLFVSIGSGASPSHPQNKSNQATYSQSFVREDVPLSYQYSAVHYYTPKKHVESEHVNSKKNNYKPESSRISGKNIQYAPVHQNSREYIHPTEPILYTSVTPTRSASPEYEQYYDAPEISNESVVNKHNLEPKREPIEVKYIKPSTYKPHLNHNVRMYNSPKLTLQPNQYYRLNTQATTEKPRKLEMDDILHQLDIYESVQHPPKKANYIGPATTDSSKYSNVLDPVISFLPKQSLPLITIPHEYNRYSSLQPVPRMAYHNNNNINGPPEKSGRIQKYTRFNNILVHPLE